MSQPSESPPDPLLDGLNAPQREAVLTTEGPVLMLAGAGTGKTAALTARLAHIVRSRLAWPSEILCVTFTNKAAREMRERVGNMIGSAVDGMPFLGTFHSVAAKMLRRHAELAGLQSNYTIIDTDDQLRLLKQLVQAESVDDKRFPPRTLAACVDRWKNKGLSPADLDAAENEAYANGKGRHFYTLYQARLKALNACDFGDLLLHMLNILRSHPEVLEQYQQRFKYILVDEYQDTNQVQYLWLRLLAQTRKNICVVGDDDQSIYSWRGAEVANILRFEKDFPGATVIRLERNYRSTGHILATASALIAHNKGRLGKTLFTDGADGNKATVTGVWDDEEEARVIADDIETARKSGQKLNDMAILVRASFQMRSLEDRFVTLGLPYRVIGGPRFYERQEIKDAVAYLEVVANPVNDLKFERIINVPKRGLGDTTVRRIHELARAREIPMYQAARMMTGSDDLAGKARKSLTDLLASFERWRALIATAKHTELAEMILDESGYSSMWQSDKSPQAQSRLENLKELIRFMHQFETLGGFLEHVSLVMDVDAGNDGDRVSLMTLHAAKGLEFDTVFLPGWEEGLFPHQRSLDESGLAGLEEERRLAYVGVTRAKKTAKISFAQNRRNRGLYSAAVPSRFVDELPEAHVDVVEAKSPFGGAYQNFGGNFGGGRGGYAPSRFDDVSPSNAPFQSTYQTPGWRRAQQQWKKDGFKKKPPVLLEGELVASSTATQTTFAMDDRVFHQKFGYGRVTEIDGNKLTVEFEKAGSKRVVDSFLEKH